MKTYDLEQEVLKKTLLTTGMDILEELEQNKGNFSDIDDFNRFHAEVLNNWNNLRGSRPFKYDKGMLVYTIFYDELTLEYGILDDYAFGYDNDRHELVLDNWTTVDNVEIFKLD